MNQRCPTADSDCLLSVRKNRTFSGLKSGPVRAVVRPGVLQIVGSFHVRSPNDPSL